MDFILLGPFYELPFFVQKKNPEIPYSPTGSFKAVSKKNVKTIIEVYPKYRKVDAAPSMSNLVMK